jgi:hypothetical protein
MNLKHPILSYSQISKTAENFLNKYHSSLLPPKILIEEVQNKVNKTFASVTFENLMPVFQDIENLFQVSGEVLLRRLQKEGICKPEPSF